MRSNFFDRDWPYVVAGCICGLTFDSPWLALGCSFCIAFVGRVFARFQA